MEKYLAESTIYEVSLNEGLQFPIHKKQITLTGSSVYIVYRRLEDKKKILT